ncbi:MAG TPA: FtsQ-type POTRA domain-containing protein [Syntrophales bacterium]|nr:FtsQ-type POTRA domain-containing protein [Syntrophales bacterium]
MKKPFLRRSRYRNYRQEVRRYRLRRQAAAVLMEIIKSSLILSAIGTTGAVLIFGYIYLISHPYFAIREITVRGCKELTEKDILTTAAVKTRQNIFAVSVTDVKRRIQTNPWIKEASVGRELPDRLVIALKERTAVSLVKKDSSFFLMDLEGITFKKLEMTDDDMDLPILTGFQGPESDRQALMGRAIDLLRYLVQTNDFPNIKNVSEINGNERYGLSVFTDTGLCLYLGFDNYESKFKRLPPVMNDLERRNLKTGHLYIDLSDPVKITVQRREALPPAMEAAAKKGFKT